MKTELKKMLECYEEFYKTLYDKKEDCYHAHGLSFLLKDGNRNFSTKVSARIQEHYLQAIYELSDLAGKNGIDIMFLKGLIESYDIYDGYIRPGGDIDLLVRKRDLLDFMLLCAKNGFTFNGRDITEESVTENLYWLKGKLHVDPIYKRYGFINIPVEVHITFKGIWDTHGGSFDINPTEEIFMNSASLEINGRSVKCMGPSDRFLFGMQHFSKHFIENLTTEWYYKKHDKIRTNYKTLIDAALVYYKYGLKTDILMEKIGVYGIKDEIIIANEFLKRVFGKQFFDKADLHEIKTNKYNAFDSSISKFVTDCLDISELETCSADNVAGRFIQFSLDNNITAYADKDSIIIDEYGMNLTKKRFGTLCRDDLKPENSEDSSAEIKIISNKEYLGIEFLVKDNKVRFSGYNQKNLWGESLNILIYDPQFISNNGHFITGIFASPEITESGIHLNTAYFGDWRDDRINNTFPIDGKDCNVEVLSDGYRVTLNIKWDLLQIDYNKLKCLGMEFVINDVDSNEKELHSVLCWSNPAHHYFDPSKFGKIIFEKSNAD